MDPATATEAPALTQEPGTPLGNLSPERVNNIRSPIMTTGRGSLPASPSQMKLGSPPKLSHSRAGSDIHVQGMVARFNQLEIRDHKELHRRDEAAIRRAEMAREIAELEARKMRESRDEVEHEARRIRDEARKYKKEVEESRERERKVAKRLEVVMDELHRAKDTHSHAQGLYEKEIRKARKEAFKASSALVKLQEELKATRNSLRITQSGLESEKNKVAKREQEAFSAKYQLVGVQEELSKAKEQIKVVEEERDALKTSLKEEEVARIAAEGRIALPVSMPGEEDEFDSPKKSPSKICRANDSDKENCMPPARDVELEALEEQLAAERRRREGAEDTVEFMKMECQFRCCSCRVAELNGSDYIHDDTFEREMAKIRASLPITITPPLSEDDAAAIEAVSKHINIERPATPPSATNPADKGLDVTFSPTTGTFRSVPSPNKDTMQERPSIEDTIMTEVETSTPADVTEFESALTQPTSLCPSPTETAPKNTAPAPAEAATTSRPPSPPRTPSAASSRHNTLNRHQPAWHPEQPQQQQQVGEQTPANRLHRTITTTTTIPMCFDSPKPNTASYSGAAFPSATAPTTPAGGLTQTPSVKERPFDRDAALEQIEQRRRRARSIAEGHATPRRQMVEGAGPRRDISAPAVM